MKFLSNILLIFIIHNHKNIECLGYEIQYIFSTCECTKMISVKEDYNSSEPSQRYISVLFLSIHNILLSRKKHQQKKIKIRRGWRWMLVTGGDVRVEMVDRPYPPTRLPPLICPEHPIATRDFIHDRCWLTSGLSAVEYGGSPTELSDLCDNIF